MKRNWIPAFAGMTIGLLIASFAFAGGDELVLKDGTVVKGDIVAQNAAQYYVNVSGKVEKIDISDVKEIHFGPVPERKMNG